MQLLRRSNSALASLANTNLQLFDFIEDEHDDECVFIQWKEDDEEEPLAASTEPSFAVVDQTSPSDTDYGMEEQDEFQMVKPKALLKVGLASF